MKARPHDARGAYIHYSLTVYCCVLSIMIVMSSPPINTDELQMCVEKNCSRAHCGQILSFYTHDLSLSHAFWKLTLKQPRHTQFSMIEMASSEAVQLWFAVCSHERSEVRDVLVKREKIRGWKLVHRKRVRICLSLGFQESNTKDSILNVSFVPLEIPACCAFVKTL